MYDGFVWSDTSQLTTSVTLALDTVNLPWDTYDYRWQDYGLKSTSSLPPSYSPIVRFFYPSGQIWP